MSVKSALQDFHEKPNLVKAWIRAGLKWWDSHPNANSHKKFADIYEVFVHNYFYRSYEDFDNAVHGGMFGHTDCKEFLEKEFNIKL